LIKENNELKKQVEQLRTIKKEELSTATIEEYLEDDSDIIEEEIEIVIESGPTVIEDNTKLKDCTYPRDDYYRVIMAYHTKYNNFNSDGLIQYARQFHAIKQDILIERLGQVVEYEEYLRERYKIR